ncbi:MAG: bifunctional precorrin-2 dehydrogenase/sirohydrochlorin ferrochelatase, partial [Ruminococcus sp.]
VALRNLEKLLPFNPKITVIAPVVCDEIKNNNNINILKRNFIDSDIDDAFMVISATDDNGLNAHIFELCQKNNILINTVDNKEKCGFIFPALVRKDNLTVGISTSGKSPLYAKFLRKKIENSIDERCGETIYILDKYRSLIKREIKSEENRKKAFERILARCLENENNIDEEEIKNIIEDFR